MVDYIKGIIFIPVFIYFLAHLGKKISKNDKFGANLIVGYVTYTVFQFFGGFIAQQFRLPWMVYQSYMIVLLITLIVFSVYHNKVVFNKDILKSHFRKYGVLYMIALVFVVLSCMNIQFQWNANNVDDGYYLNKIRMAPYVGNFTDYNYAVGIPAPGSIIRNLNTYELEAAFFSKILGIEASIYAKVFLAYFNFTFLLHLIYLFYTTVLGTENKVKKLSIALVPILFFGIYYGIQINFGLLSLNDTWQNSSAMWYGSTLVKTTSIFLLLLPVYNKNRLSIKEMIFYVGICLTLFSKASQVLPVLVIIFMIYTIQVIFKYLKNKFNFKSSFVFLIIVIICLILLPKNPEIQNRAILIDDLLAKNMKIIVKMAIFVIALSYYLSYRLLKKWNTWLLLFGVFILTPGLNTIFLYSSMYDFVVSRTFELYYFTMLMTAALIIYLGLINYVENMRKIVLIYSAIAICFISIPLISIQKNIGIVHTLKILAENPKLLPTSTLELGDKLENLAQVKGEKLKVLMPMWLVIDGTPHALASTVRYTSFHNIISLGSIARFSEQMENSEYRDLNQDTLDVFEKYQTGEDIDNKKLKQILDKYTIDCIVVFYDEAANRIEKEFGFKRVGQVLLSDKYHKYTILYRE